MELDETTKEAVKYLGKVINAAVEESSAVKMAVENLHEIGFDPILTLKLEIGLQEVVGNNEIDNYFEADEDTLELTADDLRTLQKLKIRI